MERLILSSLEHKRVDTELTIDRDSYVAILSRRSSELAGIENEDKFIGCWILQPFCSVSTGVTTTGIGTLS